MDEERVKWSKILLVDKSDGSSTSRDRHSLYPSLVFFPPFFLFVRARWRTKGERMHGEENRCSRETSNIYIYVYIQWLSVEDLEFCNFGFEISLSRIVNFRKIREF